MELCGVKLRAHLSKMNPYRAPIVIPSLAKHTATMFFLHGRGDTGDGWASILDYTSPLPHVKFVCPHAAVRPCTIAGGDVMPTWFDVFNLKMEKFDEIGIRAAMKQVHQLISDEISAGIPAKRIIVSGFSQGGALALGASLTYVQPLAGCAVLSTYFPMPDLLVNEVPDANKQMPVFQAHGDSDPLLLERFSGGPTSLILKKLCENHVYKVYKGLGHDASEKVLADMFSYIKLWVPEHDDSSP